MDQEERDYLEEKEIDETLERYEKMLASGNIAYFDVYQFEYIVDEFVATNRGSMALQAIEMGLSQHPSSLHLLSKKSQVLMNVGEIREALTLTNKLLKVEESNHELYLIKGSAHLILGEEDKAVMVFDKAIEISYEAKDDTIYNIGFAFLQSNN